MVRTLKAKPLTAEQLEYAKRELLVEEQFVIDLERAIADNSFVGSDHSDKSFKRLSKWLNKQPTWMHKASEYKRLAAAVAGYAKLIPKV